MENSNGKYEQEQRTYYLRGMGVLCLVALLFAAGMWRFGGGSMEVSSYNNGQSLPVSRVATGQKHVALTFNVTGTADSIEEILRILEEYQVQATFFLTEEWVDTYPGRVKQIYAAGHEIGNHSAENEIALQHVHEQVKELTGETMTLYRPKSGECDNVMMQLAKRKGYLTVYSSIDSEDWKDYGVASIISAVVNHRLLTGGDIILLHSDAKYTSEALPQILSGIAQMGYDMKTVSELLLDLDVK